MPVTVNAVVAEPRQTAAWLTANDPILPAGVRYTESDTGRSKKNYNLTATAHWSALAYELVGEKGDPGPTPYERQVQLGFVGTEEDWYTSIKGDKGDNGLSLSIVVGSTIPATGSQTVGVLYVRV